jgi:Transcriptional regulator
MPPMNLNTLRIFAVVARHGNLRRAAEALNLSPGAVSQRIKQLEIDLGVVLLERQPRGVTLTPEGERCRAAVDTALAGLETLFAEFAGTGEQVTLHLGASTAAKWLMPRMADFEARFPGVVLTTEVHSRPLSRGLGRNEIALWPGTGTDPAPFGNARKLTDIRLVAVCSPDFPRPDWPMGLETLLNLPLLQDSNRRWEKLIAATGHGGRARMLNFDRSALALEAATEGHGIAIAPSYIVERDIAMRRLVEVWIDPAPPVEHLFLSWSPEHIRQPNIRRIVDWIASEFAQEPGGP